MLNKIYDDMWNSSYPKIENNQYEIDTAIIYSNTLSITTILVLAELMRMMML